MSGRLLRVLKPSVVFQINRDTGHCRSKSIQALDKCRSVLKSALTQFWCSLGTRGTVVGIDDESVTSPKLLS
jgi:hypothetical protein